MPFIAGGRIFQCDPAAGMPPQWWPLLTKRQKQLFGMVDSVRGPPPCKTYDPDTGDKKPGQLNGDFGGFQVRQFTAGQYELATAVPGFCDIANAGLVETKTQALETKTQASARL